MTNCTPTFRISPPGDSSDGILSRTLHNDDAVKVVLFAFSTGQELSEHTLRCGGAAGDQGAGAGDARR